MDQTIVFVPGHMCDERLFSYQIKFFESKYNIITADLTKRDTVRQSALDILKNAPKSFILVGLSMGGIVAMEIARIAQERITKLVLIDTNPYADKPDVISIRESLIKKVEEGNLFEVISQQYIPKYFTHKPEDKKLKELCLNMALKLGSEVFINQSRALISRPCQMNTLKSLKCKTLIIYGREDIICPLSLHLDMKKFLINSELEILDNTGHLSVLENPLVANSSIYRFLI